MYVFACSTDNTRNNPQSQRFSTLLAKSTSCACSQYIFFKSKLTHIAIYHITTPIVFHSILIYVAFCLYLQPPTYQILWLTTHSPFCKYKYRWRMRERKKPPAMDANGEIKHQQFSILLQRYFNFYASLCQLCKLFLQFCALLMRNVNIKNLSWFHETHVTPESKVITHFHCTHIYTNIFETARYIKRQFQSYKFHIVDRWCIKNCFFLQ